VCVCVCVCVFEVDARDTVFDNHFSMQLPINRE
jgi:hypothetical protein